MYPEQGPVVVHIHDLRFDGVSGIGLLTQALSISLVKIFEVKLSVSLEEMKCREKQWYESPPHSLPLWRKLQFLLWCISEEELF